MFPLDVGLCLLVQSTELTVLLTGLPQRCRKFSNDAVVGGKGQYMGYIMDNDVWSLNHHC